MTSIGPARATLTPDTSPVTQMVLREGFWEFGWGQPDPDLLPVAAVRSAMDAALDAWGPTMLGYGAAEGARPLRSWIRARVLEREGLVLEPGECITSAGNSDAIDQICTLFTTPGDTVVVESPTYHLALRIMRDHGLDLQPVPMDDQGLQVHALDEALDTLARAGKRARLIYTIPTYHNPTGRSLDASRRRQLVELAAARDVLVVEDDVYRELAYDGEAPPSLFGLAPRGTVLRLGSFAKSLAPGLRLGWINGSAEHLHRLSDGGLRDSGGGPNYAAGMMAASFCESGAFDAHVSNLRNEYRRRRDALCAALSDSLPSGCAFTIPRGGFFVWVTLPADVRAGELLARAEARYRVSFVPGLPFAIDGSGKSSLRLAFSLMKPDALAEGARRLGAAVADLSSEREK
jgi:DNA-binding transcriptional MocR family regulator